jgi:hypothetical protein
MAALNTYVKTLTDIQLMRLFYTCCERMDCYGWDYPTLAACKPQAAAILRTIKDEGKARKEAQSWQH